MVDFKWILSPVFLTMMLQFEDAETTRTRQLLLEGTEGVLSCENVKQGQQRCNGTIWTFSGGRTGPVELFKLGQIGENARNKLIRLSLTESCSLVINVVTAEDAGVYSCQQYNSAGQKLAEDVVDVSVVTVTAGGVPEQMTVTYSVSTVGPCGYTVKWLLGGRDLDGNIQDVTTSESSCSASVTIWKPCYYGGSRFWSMSCEVRNDYGEVENFELPLPCRRPDAETKITRQLLRAGREGVLSCESVKQGQQRCFGRTWIFSGEGTGPAVELFRLGQISRDVRQESDGLSLTESCSLVIKKVTAEDAGVYTCRQFNTAGEDLVEDVVDVSVVTVTEQRKAGVVTVNCSVSTVGLCGYTVKWLLDGRVVDGNIKDVTTSESSCYASVEILKPCDNGGSRFQSLSCRVSTGTVKVKNFNPPPLCKTPGSTAVAIIETAPVEPRDCSTLDYVMLSIRVAELLLLTVVTVLLFRARGLRPCDAFRSSSRSGEVFPLPRRPVMRSGVVRVLLLFVLLVLNHA